MFLQFLTRVKGHCVWCVCACVCTPRQYWNVRNAALASCLVARYRFLSKKRKTLDHSKYHKHVLTNTKHNKFYDEMPHHNPRTMSLINLFFVNPPPPPFRVWVLQKSERTHHLPHAHSWKMPLSCEGMDKREADIFMSTVFLFFRSRCKYATQPGPGEAHMCVLDKGVEQ